MLSSFLAPGIPSGLQWAPGIQECPKVSFFKPHWKMATSIFMRGSLDMRYRCWALNHHTTPVFHLLSSPPPTPLDIITKTHRGGFFLLIPLPFPLPRHRGAGDCALGSGQCDGACVAAGDLMAQELTSWFDDFSSSSTALTLSLLLTPVVNVANQFWLSKQPPMVLALLLKVPP